LIPRLAYSIQARLGTYGIGYIAYQAVDAAYQAQLLKRLFVSSNAQQSIPSTLIKQWGIIGRGLKYLGAKDATGIIYYLESIVFDAWVASQMPVCDVYHGWNGACLAAMRRAKQLGAKTVVERASSHPATARRLLSEEYARWNVPLRLPMWDYGRLLQEIDEADYILIPSAFVRDSMSAEGVPASRLWEIPFGADLSRFTPRAEPHSHPFRAIYAGQVSIRKGVPYLLEAWKRLAMPQAELWIVGHMTPDFQAISHLWDGLPNVKYWGHSQNLPELFQQSDVFVFPTIEEGSALITYEALACGLPMVTTPNAGSVARDGVEGFIVPIRDVEALCQRIEQLACDSELRRALSRAARQRAEQFSWAQYQKRLVTMYQQCVLPASA
jgi:glycosyltransferase involved in cell wall biosynthesis